MWIYWIIRSSWRFCAGVKQRASAGAATSSLTCAPGASANKMTLIGWSRQVAPWQWGPGLQGTTPCGTPLDTMSTWRAPSLRRPEMLPPSQDPSWAAGAPSVRSGEAELQYLCMCVCVFSQLSVWLFTELIDCALRIISLISLLQPTRHQLISRGSKNSWAASMSAK